MSPNRILIVRLGALGDIVHAIPVAAALRRAFPGAQIDWLVSARHWKILELVPVIDRRVIINGVVDGASVLSPAKHRSPQGLLHSPVSLAEAYGSQWLAHTLRGAIAELRRERYDVAIDLQGLLKSAALARLSGAGRVLGFATSYLRESLARPFYTEVYDPGCGGIYDPRETRHVVQINLGLLQPLGVSASVPEFPIERVESAVAATVCEQTGGRYALLNPGAQWPNKRWPPPRFGRVAATLRDRYGLLSVALWGDGERALADELVAHADGAAFALPPATIVDLVALARRAALMVSGDTGPIHVAAAVGTPVVGIFGPTRPTRNGPWSPNDVTVSRADLCQCHHLRRCRRERMCLLDVEVSEVVEAIEQRMATGLRRPGPAGPSTYV